MKNVNANLIRSGYNRYVESAFELIDGPERDTVEEAYYAGVILVLHTIGANQQTPDKLTRMINGMMGETEKKLEVFRKRIAGRIEERRRQKEGGK